MSGPSTVIYRVADIRAIEEAFAPHPLMERAGAAAVEDALALMGSSRQPPLIACGPGNNGGDGLVLARLLRQRGIEPVVVFAAEAARLPPDARGAHDAFLASGGQVRSDIPSDGDFSFAVDALFGIGMKRPAQGMHAELIDRLNRLRCPILAIDVPSGLDADTGRTFGPCVRATRTATFIALKPGLLTLDGPDHCGHVSVHTLGVQPEAVVPAPGRVVTRSLFSAALRARPMNMHKGMAGSVAVIGGAPCMVGAALLAGRAAMKLGAGRVYLGLLDARALAVDSGQPELMLRPAAELMQLDFATVLAVGPGLGQSSDAGNLLKQSLSMELPLVLDADALNLIGQRTVLGTHLSRRRHATLITPHPAEAGRMLGVDTSEIQADRLAAALRLAQRFRAYTVLKGNGSVLAFPDGRWFINTTGNPGMASAGMGDVLTGIAAALLAQGWEAGQALLAAVHLHGAAADAAVERGAGPIGLTAGEVIEAARTEFNHWQGPYRN